MIETPDEIAMRFVLALEQELDAQLNSSRVVRLIRRNNLPERSRRRRGVRRREQRMIERVCSFEPQLKLHRLLDGRVLDERKVYVVRG